MDLQRDLGEFESGIVLNRSRRRRSDVHPEVHDLRLHQPLEVTVAQLHSWVCEPNVKIAATERGAGQVLGGESDPTYVQVLAEGPSTSLKLSNGDGREQLIKP
jgi:hypothetical protein